MKRIIINQLVRWKSRKDRMPLLVRGARQVGKTYILNHFGEKHFSNTVTINLERQSELHSCFVTLRQHCVTFKRRSA